MTNTTILITGANRGLGRGLVEHYVSQPGHTIIAAVRDMEHETAKSLLQLPQGPRSSVIVVKIENKSDTDAETAVKTLQSTHGITSINTVIANAGTSFVYPEISQVKISDMLEHFQINTFSVVYLFQAVLPLLNKAKSPRFVTMSTSAATIGAMETCPFPNAAYGTSKAAMNYITRKIHFENPNLTTFAMSPGWVQTDLGNSGAKALGFEKAEISVSESVQGMVKVIDRSTREKTSGKFVGYDGSESLW